MSYYIGPVLVDNSTDTPTAVFPIKPSKRGCKAEVTAEEVIHQFGSGDAKIEQRFYLGVGRVIFTVQVSPLSPARRAALVQFWNSIGGPRQAFFFDAPHDDGFATSRWTVIFDPAQSLSWTNSSDLIASTTVTLIALPGTSPTYTVASTSLRFPSSALQSALLGQSQQIIPLLTIQPRVYKNSHSQLEFQSVAGTSAVIGWSTNVTTAVSIYIGNPTNPSAPISPVGGGAASGTTTVPFVFGAEYVLTDSGTGRVLASKVFGDSDAIRLSDRDCTVGGNLYRARLIGHQGFSQHLGPADDATIMLANADHAFTRLKNVLNLTRATVTFDLYHVGSQALVQFWKGQIKDWSSDEGDTFQIFCSDAIYELTLPYPPRVITRDCWKPFNLQPFCPYSTQGGGGDPTYCDKGFDTANGCQSHGMDNYFGGVVANPQGVTIRDNGSSGRPTITVTSIASDTMYGKALQEVYTNLPMPVPCTIADGRDESDFYEAIGIVGAGPIGKYGAVQNQLLDGQTQHPPYSPIFVFGSDPEPTPFSLDAGGSFQYPFKAAGVARLSIRRTDPKGIQPSTPDSHTMVAEIAEGLKGLVWVAPGNNNAGAPTLLTNPIWVAVNAFLKALGLGPGASISSQESVFDVPSAIAAAAICNLQVSTLIYNRNPVQLPVDGLNSGIGNWTSFNPTGPQLPNETQFQFIGVIRDQNPLRDWLDQILINCCGFWYMAYGKLFFGIRENAGAAEAFTIGNMLWKSYSEKPLAPAFNDLTAVFADRDFQFAQNTCRYYDQDHANAIGTNVSPRYEKGQINLPGTCSASQALRIAATRAREEIGGVNEFEWKNAREAQWKTTILALNTYPGQNVSATHPDAAGGYAKFRIDSWTLGSDYSITISGKTVTDSMYDLTSGPKPTDVMPPWLPIIPSIQTNDIPCWIPVVAPRSTITTWPIQSTFTVGRQYDTQPDGSERLRLTVHGYAPVTVLYTQNKPVIGSVKEAVFAGPYVPGRPYYVAIAAIDGLGNMSALSKVHTIVPSSASGGSISLTGMTFPSDAVEYVLFSGLSADTLTGSHRANIESAFVLSTYNPFSYGVPPDQWDSVRVRVKAKNVFRPGYTTVQVVSFDDASGRIHVGGNTLAGGVGLFVTSLGKKTYSVAPLVDYPVLAWSNGPDSASTFVIVSTPPGDPLSNHISVGDYIIARMSATQATETSIGSGTGFPGAYGFQADDSVGKLIRIISGYGAGQVRQIVSNTEDGNYFVSSPWDIIPSYFLNYFPRQPQSTFIIEDADTLWQADSEVIKNNVPGTQIALPLQIPDLSDTVRVLMLTGVITSNGYESDNENAVFREVLGL
jgi:hypothetical protein